MSTPSLFDQLAAVGQLKRETTTLKGVAVTVRELNVDQMLAYQQAEKGGSESLALLLSLALVTPEGQPALTLEQARQLMQGSLTAVQPLVRIAMKLAGLLDDEDAGEKKA
jgi:hypothetical protein